MRALLRSILTAACACAAISAAAATGPAAHADAASFTYGFDDGADGWVLHEEEVDSCYVSGAGQVTTAPSPGEAGNALVVSANASGTTKSNHVLASKKVSDSGQTGTWRYSFSAYVDPSAWQNSQTGPEFSLQSTRRTPSGWRTFTAGVQYVGNPWVTSGKWLLWLPTGSSGSADVAAWVPISEAARLDSAGWYTFTLGVDLTANTYLDLRVTAPNGAGIVDQDLSSRAVPAEAKFTESAFWATLEAENLQTCYAPQPWATSFAMAYDDVALTQVSGQFNNPPTASLGHLQAYVGETATIPLPASDVDGNLDPASARVVLQPSAGTAEVGPGGEVSYTPAPGGVGGFGFKYDVCDSLGACRDAWVEVSVPNRAPVAPASPIQVATSTGQPVTIDLRDYVTDPDANVDWGTLRIDVAPNPAVATATVDTSAGTITFRPNPGIAGEIGFHFVVDDTSGWETGQWIVATFA